MNDKWIASVLVYLDGYIEGYRSLLREQFADFKWGMHEASAEEQAAWFESMVVQNPNWASALPFVEGGMKEVYRYERTRGIAPVQTPDMGVM